jgi:hypothetical protein
MKIYDVSLGVNKAIAILSPKRVFIYASVLALLTHIIILALYIHVPRFRESPGEDFVQFYGAAILSGEQPDKIYDTRSKRSSARVRAMESTGRIYMRRFLPCF